MGSIHAIVMHDKDSYACLHLDQIENTYSLTAFDLFLNLPDLLEGSAPNASQFESAIVNTLYRHMEVARQILEELSKHHISISRSCNSRRKVTSQLKTLVCIVVLINFYMKKTTPVRCSCEKLLSTYPP